MVSGSRWTIRLGAAILLALIAVPATVRAGEPTDQIRAAIEKGITVSDDDLKKDYESRKAEYEQVKARHILIAFKGSPAAQADKPELTEEQAKAKAEDIRKQLVAGASFEEILKHYYTGIALSGSASTRLPASS